MKRITKILIALTAIVSGIVIGVIIILSFSQDYMDENEARALVEERYQGDILNVSVGENEHIYTVTIEDENMIYEVTLDRENNTVTDLKSSSNPDYTGSNENSKNEGNKKEGSNKEDKPEKGEDSPPSIISDEEARDIAVNKIGGQYLQSALNENVSPREYLVMQLIDDDDEAAIVSVNADTGNINKVIFVEIDFSEIGDLDSFIQEVADYNEENPYFYSEFDYEDGEYEEYDD